MASWADIVTIGMVGLANSTILQAVAFYYIRTLIYRPAVGSTLGPKAAPAMMSISESSKHMIQLAQLLEERSMSFSFCLNKTDLLVLCGMTLLYQSLELRQESKMMKDNERLVNVVFKVVGRAKTHSSYDFKRIACLVVSIDDSQRSLPTPPGQSPEVSMAAPPLQKSPAARPKKKPSLSTHQPQQYSLGRHSSMSETDLLLQQEKLKRMTMSNITLASGTGRPELQRSTSRASLDSARSNTAIMPRRDQRLSVSQAAMIARVSPQQPPSAPPPPSQKTNLDYLSLATQPSPTLPAQSSSATQHQQAAVSPSAPVPPYYNPVHIPQKSSSGGMSTSEWEALLGQIDGAQANLYDAIYGGPQVTLDTPVTSAVDGGWSPDALDLSAFDMGELGRASLSEESLSSVSGGDDMSSLDFRDFSIGQGTMVAGDGFMMEGMPRNNSFAL